ncbi:MAG TPA: glycosyltransferase [Tepidisphaeraceae bacterium]|jgi:glycosyltransferase involved in cell wall biosynthesis
MSDPTVTPSPSIRATVITPWWDHGELLQLWENNVQQLRDARIIFIDNGSQPPARDALQAFCKRNNITLIRNETNRGFSAANNQGAAAADSEYLLFLNNDVQIKSPPVQYLIERAGRGLAGPGPLIQELYETYLEGWCLCIPRQALSDLGGWTEDYTLGYWDDVDLCHRAQSAGLPLTPVPEVANLIHHLGNTTGRDGRIDQIALHVKNRGIFARKHYSTKPKIVIDAVFFQMYQTGIARVWRQLLETWAADGFARHIVLLDRGRTAPQIPGVRSRAMDLYDYNRTDHDRRTLQFICDEEDADVFISTYYTTPLTTPSVFMAHDMIPEIFGWDLRHPMWREKHHGIRHASAFVCVSDATRRDLLKFFPDLPADRVRVTPLAAAPCFHPRPQEQIDYVRSGVGITKPYFLTVGARGGYKNTILTFRALAQFPQLDQFDLLCAGHITLEPEFQQLVGDKDVKAFALSDDELAAAYSGAVALLHPSTYEGFGLPVLEAMACGCPVITTQNGSLAQVAGDAALFVRDDDVQGMVQALREVQQPDVRQRLITAGHEQAKKFSWQQTADAIRNVLQQVPQVARTSRP